MRLAAPVAPFDLHDPAAFDAFVFGPGAAERVAALLALPSDEGPLAYRQALALLLDRQDVTALAMLERVRGLPTVGAVHYAHARLGIPSPLLPPPRPDPRDPLALEDAYYAELARARLARRSGSPSWPGFEHVARAVHLAELLGLGGRLALVQLMRQRFLAGLADTELEEVALARERLADHPGAAQEGVRVHAELLAAKGLYREAVQLLDAHGGPLVLRARYAAALGEAPPAGGSTPADRYARALADVAAGRFAAVEYVDGLDGFDAAGARLAAAFGTLGRGEYRRAGELFGREEPGRPDQRFYWALGHFLLFARLGESFVASPFSLPARAFLALERLVRADDVLGLARRAGPRAVRLLALAPGAPASLLQEADRVPLLLGDRLEVGARTVRINKRAGETFVIDAFDEARRVPGALDRRSRQLYRERLAELGVGEGEVVPISTLFVLARRVRSRARELGRDEDVRAWTAVVDALVARSPLLRDLALGVR